DRLPEAFGLGVAGQRWQPRTHARERQLLEHLVIEANELVRVELRRCATEVRKIEARYELLERPERLDRIGSAEAREQAGNGHRLDALFAQPHEAEAAEALRQAFAGGTGEQGEMGELRRRAVQRGEDLQLHRRVGK